MKRLDWDEVSKCRAWAESTQADPDLVLRVMLAIETEYAHDWPGLDIDAVHYRLIPSPAASGNRPKRSVE